MSREQPITIEDNVFVGNDRPFIFTVEDQDTRPREPRDITGWAIEFMLAEDYSGNALFTLAAAIVDGEAGTCAFTIPGSDTEDLEGDRNYWYTLRRTDVDSVDELAFGGFWLRDVYVNLEDS